MLLGEFCGQHHVTATPAGRVLMFDNGSNCHGERKLQRITRVVEYDISSGTEARWVREYRLPEADGFAFSGGGVTALANGNWLITWGGNVQGPDEARLAEPVAVSEVDPGTGTGTDRGPAHQDGERRSSIQHRPRLPRTGERPCHPAEPAVAEPESREEGTTAWDDSEVVGAGHAGHRSVPPRHWRAPPRC